MTSKKHDKHCWQPNKSVKFWSSSNKTISAGTSNLKVFIVNILWQYKALASTYLSIGKILSIDPSFYIAPDCRQPDQWVKLTYSYWPEAIQFSGFETRKSLFPEKKPRSRSPTRTRWERFPSSKPSCWRRPAWLIRRRKFSTRIRTSRSCTTWGSWLLIPTTAEKESPHNLLSKVFWSVTKEKSFKQEDTRSKKLPPENIIFMWYNFNCHDI